MTVPNDCSLDEAIASANGAEHFIGAVTTASRASNLGSRISCGDTLGDGNDTIELNGNVTLSAPVGGATDIKRNLTIMSNTGSCVTISGTAYLAINPGAHLTLSGVGMSSDGTRKRSMIDNKNGTLTITGSNGPCLFSNNHRSNNLTDTGGILFNYDGGQTTIDGATFDFSNSNAEGGAIYLQSGKLTITSNSGNTTTFSSDSSDRGGAIWVEPTATPNITSNNFQIINNQAGSAGGAIYNNHGTVNIARGNGPLLNVSIAGNTSKSGGALFIAGGKFSMNGAVLNGNSATDHGGGAYIDDIHPGTISQDYFVQNSADQGGRSLKRTAS
jgi:hypothetical protein